MTYTLVYAASDTDRAIPLRAAAIDGTWNGFPVPVVTFPEFSSWVARMRDNDLSGMWDEVVISATSYAITLTDENGIDTFEVIGNDDTVDAHELYALSGWTWTL